MATGALPSPSENVVGSRPRGRAIARPARQLLGEYAKSLDVVRFGIAGSIVITLSAVQMYLGPVAKLRPAFVFLALAVATALLRPASVRWANLTKGWVPKGVLLLVVLACLSAPFGISPKGSIRFMVEVYLRIVILFALTMIAIRGIRDLAVLMWSFLVGIGTLAYLAFTVIEMEADASGLDRLGEGRSMFDANDIGMLMVIALPIAFLLFYNSKKVGRLFAMAILPGIPATIALTGSRGAIIGLLVTGPMLFFALKRVGMAVRAGVLVLFVAGVAVAAPAGYWEQVKTIVNPTADYNASEDYGRIELAKRGLHYMGAYPLFGVGVSNFSRAEGTISPIANARIQAGLAVEWLAPHNTYVQVGAEMGPAALLVWLSLLATGTFGMLALRRRLPRAWERHSAERKFLRDATLFLPISVVGFATTSFFLSHAYTPPPYFLLAFCGAVQILARSELAADRRIAAAGSMPSRGRA